jgi:hypothetical protein
MARGCDYAKKESSRFFKKRPETNVGLRSRRLLFMNKKKQENFA